MNLARTNKSKRALFMISLFGSHVLVQYSLILEPRSQAIGNIERASPVLESDVFGRGHAAHQSVRMEWNG